MKCLGSVSVCSMHYSLRNVEERMRNVNKKKYLKRMENVTDVFRAHFKPFYINCKLIASLLRQPICSQFDFKMQASDWLS